MKKLKINLNIFHWVIFWEALGLSLILNPILRDDWYWYEYFGVFAFILLGLILFQIHIKKVNLGIALASSYFALAVIVAIWLHLFTVEQGWDAVGLYFIGYPSTRLTYWVQTFFADRVYISDGVISQGMAMAILGCTQYFLVGFTLEKIYRVIATLRMKK